MKKKKSLIVDHDAFLENSSVLGVFWPRRGLRANHGTDRKSAIFPQPGNQKQLKWSNTAYVNKRSFTFKIKCCVFQVTKTYFCMKVIRIFTTKPAKIPHFNRPLTRERARWPHFFIAFFKIFISWMLTMPSFKKSLIEQFQGNYPNRPFYSCLLSDLTLEWQRGWSWPCFDTDLTAFVSLVKLFLC